MLGGLGDWATRLDIYEAQLYEAVKPVGPTSSHDVQGWKACVK